MSEMTHPKKQQKTDRHHGGKNAKLVSKWDGFFTPVTLQKSLKLKKSLKWGPGTSRDPKGIQKAPKGIQKVSKRRPKGIQKASKLIQIRPHWNTNSKIPMQRTAKNLAPYQSFPTERNHKIGTVAGCAAHWRVHRRTSIILKNHRSNPKAKNCKEPCTPSDLTKRRVTSRCGGVASAFSIELIIPYLYHYSLKTIRGPTRTA